MSSSINHIIIIPYIQYFIIEPPVLLPLTFGTEVVNEGEFAQLVCIVRMGDEPLTLSWALKGDKISSEPGLTTASLGTRTSMLTISSVGYRHSGTYTCTAKNNAGVTSQTATLKVNGNFMEEVADKLGVIGGMDMKSSFFEQLFL